MDKPRAFIHHDDGKFLFGTLVVGRLRIPIAVLAVVSGVWAFVAMVSGFTYDAVNRSVAVDGWMPGVAFFMVNFSIVTLCWILSLLTVGVVKLWSMIKEENGWDS